MADAGVPAGLVVGIGQARGACPYGEVLTQSRRAKGFSPLRREGESSGMRRGGIAN